MLQLKLLPGAMLLMLASTLSTNPVSAQTDPASGTGGMQNQMNMNTPQTPTRTNTQPVPTPMQMDGMQMQQSTPRSMETTTNMVSGTIRSIEGETVTLEMADGMTKQMMVSRTDLQRLNLREGMQISATLDARSMASNITVAQAGTEATSSQVGRTSTSTQSTTSTITTEADVSSDTPTTTTTENTRTVQSTPANRPVRALW